jgi:hypothetical protein
MPVQYIGLDIRDGMSDGNGLLAYSVSALPGGHVDRCLRRPVQIVQFGIHPRNKVLFQIHRQSFTAADDTSQSRARFNTSLLQEESKHGWNEMEGGNSLAGDH